MKNESAAGLLRVWLHCGKFIWAWEKSAVSLQGTLCLCIQQRQQSTCQVAGECNTSHTFQAISILEEQAACATEAAAVVANDKLNAGLPSSASPSQAIAAATLAAAVQEDDIRLIAVAYPDLAGFWPSAAQIVEGGSGSSDTRGWHISLWTRLLGSEPSKFAVQVCPDFSSVNSSSKLLEPDLSSVDSSSKCLNTFSKRNLQKLSRDIPALFGLPVLGNWLGYGHAACRQNDTSTCKAMPLVVQVGYWEGQECDHLLVFGPASECWHPQALRQGHPDILWLKV